MRFLQRHVHAGLLTYFETGLTELGWVNDPVNFGEDPMTFLPTDRGTRLERIVPSALALTIDQESRDVLAELGGRLYETEITVLADVYGSTASAAVSIASDIKDLIRGRTLPIKDATTSVDTGVVAELEDATISRPAGDVNALEFKGAWRVVTFFARVHFPD